MSVFMRHHDLPDNDPIEVAESAVPQHRAQGWEVTDPPPEPKAEDETDGDEPHVEKKATPRRPRTKKEQD